MGWRAGRPDHRQRIYSRRRHFAARRHALGVQRRHLFAEPRQRLRLPAAESRDGRAVRAVAPAPLAARDVWRIALRVEARHPRPSVRPRGGGAGAARTARLHHAAT
eukprot:1618292-Prymnesium_polylepis.1